MSALDDYCVKAMRVATTVFCPFGRSYTVNGVCALCILPESTRICCVAMRLIEIRLQPPAKQRKLPRLKTRYPCKNKLFCKTFYAFCCKKSSTYSKTASTVSPFCCISRCVSKSPKCCFSMPKFFTLTLLSPK